MTRHLNALLVTAISRVWRKKYFKLSMFFLFLLIIYLGEVDCIPTSAGVALLLYVKLCMFDVTLALKVSIM